MTAIPFMSFFMQCSVVFLCKYYSKMSVLSFNVLLHHYKKGKHL